MEIPNSQNSTKHNSVLIYTRDFLALPTEASMHLAGSKRNRKTKLLSPGKSQNICSEESEA